jgi:hypothetical protein
MKLKMPIFFAVLGILFILAAGCTSPPQSPVTPTPPPTTEMTPVPTTETPMPTTPAATFTRDQVNQLFIDIAFGCDNTWIYKISPTPENHLFYNLDGVVTPADIDFVKQFAKNYNLMTSVETFSDDPLNSKGAPIIFYPEDSMKSLERTYIGCQELDQKTGSLLYMIYNPIVEYPSGERVVATKIYINAGLQGDQRNHYLERAMLYYLGFPGQTYDYPDSFFYYNSQSNVDFLPIDIEAIKTMQNPGIYPGMSVQEVRWLLLNN